MTHGIGRKDSDISWYYNMSIGRLVYINRSDHDQMELVDEDPTGIKIGFGDSFPYHVIERELKIHICKRVCK